MNINITNYDPTKVSVVISGLVITGFADSSVVAVARNEDIVTPSVGAQGDVVYSENANQSATITLSLQSTSASVYKLRQMALSRQEVDIVISDAGNDGGELLSAGRCRITKVPDSKKEKTAGSVDITIFAPAVVQR